MSGTVGDARKRLAESVSAANEVKLTEAERELLLEGPSSGGLPKMDGESERERLVRAAERILGARLSAREPDNEAESLRRWKAEANLVLDQWDQVWGALGKPGALGSSRALSSLAAVERLIGPVSGVPTEAVRELAERVAAECNRLAQAGDRYDQAEQHEYAGGLREAAHHVRSLLPLVQRAAETNESGTP